MGGKGHTRSEQGKSAIKAVFVNITQDCLLLAPNLTVSTQNNQHEA